MIDMTVLGFRVAFTPSVYIATLIGAKQERTFFSPQQALV